MQWGCWDVEMWMDPSRGVICRGPKGPSSYLPAGSLNITDLPPNAELLQEDVLVRFLASHKSKEADNAFMNAMNYPSNYKDVPERVNQPAIFSSLTKTHIAVANNVWESDHNLVDRTCLGNGFTRFQLRGDRLLWLELNSGIEKAWLSQAWSVFHARGISLEDDLEEFDLIYPVQQLHGYLDESPSKCQRRHQQPIFLFVSLPPSDLLNGKTSSFHHWSFHHDGHSHISPELCNNLGLPVFLGFCNQPPTSYSWPSNEYQWIHQYQLLRDFDPTTTDFARHLKYNDNIFQPLNDNDRFKEVNEDRSFSLSESRTDAGKSSAGTDTKGPEDTQDPGPAEISVSTVDLQAMDNTATRLQHGIANKRRKIDAGMGRVETCTQPYQGLYHKNSTAEHVQTAEDVPLRPTRLVRTLSRRTHPSSLEYFAENQWRVHQSESTAISDLDLPSHPYHTQPGIFPRSESILPPTIAFSSMPPQRQSVGCFGTSQVTVTSSFDSSPLFSSYIPLDNDPTTVPTNSAYADPNVYSVSTIIPALITSNDSTLDRARSSGLDHVL
ncbi:hypothetical protein PM082_014781 [Marasmius tenuissimus]|nr:hypothetical protein PM082_014781 [Marasmius tenuissimus]